MKDHKGTAHGLGMEVHYQATRISMGDRWFEISKYKTTFIAAHEREGLVQPQLATIVRNLATKLSTRSEDDVVCRDISTLGAP